LGLDLVDRRTLYYAIEKKGMGPQLDLGRSMQ